MISFSWSPGAWRKKGSGERERERERHLDCAPPKDLLIHAPLLRVIAYPCAARDSPNHRTSSHRPRPHLRGPSPQRSRSDPDRPPPPDLTPTPQRSVVRAQDAGGRRNPGRGSPGCRGGAEALGTWSGNVVVPGGGGIGAGTWRWQKRELEGEGGAGLQRPLPAAGPRRGLLFS